MMQITFARLPAHGQLRCRQLSDRSVFAAAERCRARLRLRVQSQSGQSGLVCATDRMPAREIDAAAVRAALEGDSAALHELVEVMTPIVHSRVARSLGRRRETRGRDIRPDIADFTQEVFVALFTDDAKALRSWNPTRGLSFINFVGLLAQRRVATLLRVRKRNTWYDEPLRDSEPPMAAANDSGSEASAVSRELLGRLLDRLETMLSPRGLDLFQRLYMDEQSVEEVCAQTGLNPNAVHQWRRRLGIAARRALEELQGASSSQPAMPQAAGAGRPLPSVK